MLEINTYVSIVTDNADVYEGNGGTFGGPIWRYTPPGQRSSRVYAYDDIADIDTAAVKCIDMMDKHDMPK